MPKFLQPYVWKQAPFIRLLPALVIGILLQQYVPVSVVTILSWIVLVILLLIYFTYENVVKRYVHLPARGLLFQLFILLSGMLVRYGAEIQQKTNWYGHYLNEARAFEGYIISKPEEKENTHKFIVSVRTVITSDTIFPAIGKMMVYLKKKGLDKFPHLGDQLIYKNKVGEIPNLRNPGSFDYKEYLAKRRIFHQANLSARDVVIDIVPAKGMDAILQRSLNYENSLFEKYIEGRNSSALMKALLTGDRGDIEKNIVQAYANTGVVHILSISGLHIGLIYLFLLKVSNLIPLIRKKKILRLILVLTGIWFFALLTGCGPSVLRSTLMFSFLSVGILQSRKVVTYNFWAASAFVLLCFDPMLLWDIGFQLSYAAVLGILIWQRPIYSRLVYENKIMDYTWQLVSVSLSAQILTLPICLYNFHQFPLLFIFANLVAVPLVSIGLWLGMLMIFFGWITVIAKVLGFFVDRIFNLLDSFILYVDSIRYGLWSGFFPGIYEVIVLYLLIIFLSVWLWTKEKLALKLSLISLLMLAAFFGLSQWERWNQERLVVYSNSGSSGVDYYDGVGYFNFETLQQNGSMILESGRRSFRVTHSLSIPSFQSETCEFFTGKRNFLKINGKPYFKIPSEKIKLDAIILSNSPDINIGDLHKIFDASIYIFTSDNRQSLVEKWKKECEELHLRSRDSRYQPALVFNF